MGRALDLRSAPLRVVRWIAWAAGERERRERFLTAIAGDVLRVAGKAYRLSEAAQAHAELESGRTSGALYLTV